MTVDEPTPEPVAVRGAICNPIAPAPVDPCPLAVAERGTTRSPSATEVPIPDAVAVRMATSTVVVDDEPDPDAVAVRRTIRRPAADCVPVPDAEAVRMVTPLKNPGVSVKPNVKSVTPVAIRLPHLVEAESQRSDLESVPSGDSSRR